VNEIVNPFSALTNLTSDSSEGGPGKPLGSKEIQRLQRQVQYGPTAAAGMQNRASAGQAGSAARFMDTAQYYGGWQR
jgi:hypothetical protein